MHYAWSEKNTKPKIPSDERHRQKINGFLTVDVQRGSTCVDFKKQSTTEIVVGVVVLTVLIYLQKGFNHLTFLLDNAKIHGKKMETNMHKWLAEIAQQVTFNTTTRYGENIGLRWSRAPYPIVAALRWFTCV